MIIKGLYLVRSKNRLSKYIWDYNNLKKELAIEKADFKFI